MKPIRIVATAALVAGLAASCSGNGSSIGGTSTAGSPTSAATTAVASTAPPTTGATTSSATSAPGSTTADTSGGSSTSSGATTTTAPCTAPTESTPVAVNFPGPLSSVWGDDVDTGGHGCFERVVLNFSGTGDVPGYWVRYVPDPLNLAVSGQTTQLKGDANLVITVGAWMGELGNFTGQTQLLFPKNVDKVKEVTLIDNSEGVMIWGVGLDKERPFKVFVLKDPLRLVVDIAAT